MATISDLEQAQSETAALYSEYQTLQAKAAAAWAAYEDALRRRVEIAESLLAPEAIEARFGEGASERGARV